MDIRRSALAAFVGLVLAFQLAVPTAALFAHRPARFGWQMYAAVPSLPQAWLVFADGHEEPVDLAQVFATKRAEINYAYALRRGLCGVTAAVAIRLVLPDHGQERVSCG